MRKMITKETKVALILKQIFSKTLLVNLSTPVLFGSAVWYTLGVQGN